MMSRLKYIVEVCSWFGYLLTTTLAMGLFYVLLFGMGLVAGHLNQMFREVQNRCLENFSYVECPAEGMIWFCFSALSTIMFVLLITGWQGMIRCCYKLKVRLQQPDSLASIETDPLIEPDPPA